MLLPIMPIAPHAEPQLHDPNLPSAAPEALRQLSDTQIRQRIMQESQLPYAGRCVCPYQTQDTNGQSCRHRHELITKSPRPICYPGQVTHPMIQEWRRRHERP
jgi:hypothetical protein